MGFLDIEDKANVVRAGLNLRFGGEEIARLLSE